MKVRKRTALLQNKKKDNKQLFATYSVRNSISRQDTPDNQDLFLRTIGSPVKKKRGKLTVLNLPKTRPASIRKRKKQSDQKLRSRKTPTLKKSISQSNHVKWLKEQIKMIESENKSYTHTQKIVESLLSTIKKIQDENQKLKRKIRTRTESIEEPKSGVVSSKITDILQKFSDILSNLTS